MKQLAWAGDHALARIRRDYPVSLHGVCMSIGGPQMARSEYRAWPPGSCVEERPTGQGIRRHPQCKTATPTQACLVLRPIRHPEFHLCDVMTTIGVVFVRHGTRIKLIAILFAYR